MKKIFLEDLPKNKNGTVSWKNSVGCKVRFEYDEISGVIEIIGYDNSKYHVIVQYKDRTRSMFVGSFKDCLIKELIGLIHSEYYYNINDVIYDKYLVKEQTKIPHAKTRNPNAKSRSGMNKAYVVECLNCGYEFIVGEDIICSGLQISYCPACTENPKKIVRRYNDLWTTNPEIAKMLLDPEVGYAYFKTSADKTDWICPNCKSIIKNRAFNQVYYHGLACKKCGDGISYPEKIMRECLERSGITFEMHKRFDWSDNKEYDFYLPDYNTIIETHGCQHYKESFVRLGGLTLKEVQENDSYKENLANQNNIKEYIIIDCRVSDFDYIYNNIIFSKLKEIIDFETIDKNIIAIKSLTNYLILSCEMWNSGIKDINVIADKIMVSPYTVSSYLKRCDKLGLCDYTQFMKEVSRKALSEAIVKKPVRCKTTNEVFDSMTEAAIKHNTSASAIRKSCLNPRRSAGKLLDKTKLYWEYIGNDLS